MYSALKLSRFNFSGGRKEKTNCPPSDCSNISGMSPVTKLILWRHQKTFAASLEYSSLCVAVFFSFTEGAVGPNPKPITRTRWKVFQNHQTRQLMFNERGKEIKRLRKLSPVRCPGLRDRGGKTWIKCLLVDGLQRFLFPAFGHQLKK